MTSGYGTILRRHLVLVVVMGLVGLALGGLVYAQRDQQYEASADVRLSQVTSPFRSSDGTKADLSRALQTQIDLATSDQVRAKVSGPVSEKAPVVTLHGERDELRFTARSDDRNVAAETANAWAAGYVAVLKAQADAADAQYQAALESAYDRISQEIVSIDAQRRAATAENRPLLDLRRDVLVAEIKALAGRLGSNGSNTASPLAAEVVRKAKAPSDPANDDLLWYLLVGLGAGLVLGYIVAAIVEARRDLVRGPEDVELVGPGEPVLGPVATGADLATLARLSGDVGYLSLRADALAVSAGSYPAVFGVLSPAGEVEAASVALALALSMRRQGQRVLLVDANVGATRDLLQLSDLPGLAGVLYGGVPVDEAITTVAASEGMELAVLPMGRLQVGDLAGPAFDALVQDLLRDQQPDALVISGGGVSSSPDATAVAVVATSVLVVATVRQTRRREVASALRRLDTLAPKARAVVLATAARRAGSSRQAPRDTTVPAAAAAGSATEEGLTGLSRGPQ